MLLLLMVMMIITAFGAANVPAANNKYKLMIEFGMGGGGQFSLSLAANRLHSIIVLILFILFFLYKAIKKLLIIIFLGSFYTLSIYLSIYP